jgi:hypothetical protein
MAVKTIGLQGNSGSISSFGLGITYATARNGGATLSVSTTLIYTGQGYLGGDDDYFELAEGFIDFDSSFIGASGSVTSCTIQLDMIYDDSATDYTIEARAVDYGTTLETSDWINGGSISGTIVGSLATSGIGSPGLKTFTITASTVNKTGRTRLVLASSRLRLGNQPTGAETVVFANNANATVTIDGTFNNLPANVTATVTQTLGSFVNAGVIQLPNNATITQTVGSFTNAISATYVPPIVTLVGVQTLGSFVNDIAAADTEPARSATLAQTVGSFVNNLYADFNAPSSGTGLSLAAVQSLGAFVNDVSATVTPAAVTATLAQTLGSFVNNLYADFDTPNTSQSYTATVAQTVGSFVNSVAATFDMPPATATLAQTLGAFANRGVGYLGNYTVTPGRVETLNVVTRETVTLRSVDTVAGARSFETLSIRRAETVTNVSESVIV